MENAQPITSIPSNPQPRITTGIESFDKFTGGGLTNSQCILLAGLPGGGKSTMLLQLSKIFANNNERVLYCSGEENLNQIKLRSDRLNTNFSNIYLSENTELNHIYESIEKINPKIVIIDSLQMLWDNKVDEEQGSEGQVKSCFLDLVNYIKKTDKILITIGHANKANNVGGLLRLQHMCDSVFFIMVSRSRKDNSLTRTLIAMKNRFGGIDEPMNLTMTEQGFKELIQDYQQSKQTTSTEDYILLNGKPFTTIKQPKQLSIRNKISLWCMLIITIFILLCFIH